MTPPIAALKDRPAVQSFGSAMAALTASLSYAKITPAALHCGEFGGHCLENAEATGGRPEFGVGDRRRRVGGEAAPGAKPSCMAAC
jgi:hypothetical protein